MEYTDSIKCVELLGLRLATCSPEQAAGQVLRVAGSRRITVAFVNMHTANLSCEHPGYHHALSNADILFNDGLGVELAFMLLGTRVISDLPGNVVIPHLLRKWRPDPCRVFLVGSSEDVIRRAGSYLMESFNNVRVTGTKHGFFAEQAEHELVKRINGSESDMLLVGMGNPRQEEFIARNRDRLNVRVAVALGGLVDIWGGKLMPYPTWISKLRCHWLLRIVQEPSRMWRRYLVGGPVFFARVLRYRSRYPGETAIAQRFS